MLTREENKQGTTLEVLQANPLGTLPVTFAAAPHVGVIGHIVALRAQIGNQEAAAYLQTDERGLASHWAPVSKFLPVLRPFSALCEPLPDGTVPAVEVAKIQDRLRRNIFKATWKPGGDPAMFQLWERTENGTERVYETIHEVVFWRDLHALSANYLRSKHFAVGLKAHQYIPKSAASPLLATERPGDHA